MDIGKAIHNFVIARKVENCTPKTLKWYGNTLHNFRRWLVDAHSITEVEDLQVVYLREWISFLQETISPSTHKKRSDAAIASFGRALSAFCHWLEDEKVIEKPITTNFRLPRVEKKFIPTFTPEDVTKMFEACEVADKNLSPKMRRALTVRNRAILAVLLDTGIRLKELVGLRLGDVDRDRRLLLVHRKGNWWQQVPITWDGFKYLHEYLTNYRSYLASVAARDDKANVRLLSHKDDPVFLTRSGKPLGAAGIDALFNKLERETGIEGKRVSAHNCRRYMATTQLAAGRSPFDVQRQMGHSTLTMTNHYASLSTEQLQQSHDSYSPLRSKSSSDNQKALGTGYWDIE